MTGMMLVEVTISQCLNWPVFLIACWAESHAAVDSTGCTTGFTP